MSPEMAASLLFHTLAAFALGGAILLLLALFWRSIGNHITEFSGKVVIEVVQLLALGTSIATGFGAVEKKELWLRPAIASAFCVLCWKLFQIALDWRIKGMKEDKDVELAVYERQAANYACLLGVLCGLVNEKVGRLREMVGRGYRVARLEHVRDSLTPRPHLDELLRGIAEYFCQQLPQNERRAKGFRVGVYAARDSVMTPIHGVNSRDPGFNPFTSFRSHEYRFRLDATEPSHVVQAVNNRAMILVEDCEASANAGAFFYFNPGQRNYLRSMVCYYLGEVSLEDGTITPAALVIDSDAPGFFKESEQEAIRYCLHEFGVRIKLELLLQVLVERRGTSNERRSETDAGVIGADGGGEETGGD